MKLWRIAQTVNDDYDTYDSAIVAANTNSEARNTPVGEGNGGGVWAAPEHVTVEWIGTAKRGTKPGVILASFNAG